VSAFSNHLSHHINCNYSIMSPATGFALVTPASRGLGFAFAQQLLARTELPVIATARKNCNDIHERLLSSEGVPENSEKRLRVLEVDVTGIVQAI
jgi:NAD(P)-dependent dehydrogenase (short-subunit alcohol dehydrogenase family)